MRFLIADEDQTIADEAATIADEDQTIADEDQTIINEAATIANEDQTIINEDQTITDEDQTITNEAPESRIPNPESQAPEPKTQNPTMLLHYPLKSSENTELVEDQVPSAAPYHGVVQGGIGYVPNGLLGSVAFFAEKEQYIKIPPIDLSNKKDATILFWYKAGYQKGVDNTVFLMEAETPIEGTDIVPMIAVRSSESEQIEVAFTTVLERAASKDTPATKLVRHEWLIARESPSDRLRQIAIVFSGKKVQIYLNGVSSAINELNLGVFGSMFGMKGLSEKLFGKPILATYKKVQLGNLASNVACQVGQFRLFDEALTETQIKDYYKEDLQEGAKESNNTLVLDLSFSEVRDQKIQDTSESGQRVHLVGASKIDFDTERGSSTIFDGEQNFAQIAPFVWLESDGLSFEAWMKPTDHEEKRVIFTLYQSLNKEAKAKKQSAKELVQVYLDITGDLKLKHEDFEVTATIIPLQKWVHIAFSLSKSGEITTYIDGMVVNRGMKSPYKIDWENQELYGIISGEESGKGLFKGNLSACKLHRKVLNVQEIQGNIKQGQAQNTAWRTTYPLEVKLQTYKDDDYLSVLYIEPTGKGSPLVLDIKNTAPTALIFRKIETLDEHNYHFQLRFRQNVIHSRVWEYLNKEPHADLKDWNYAIGNSPESREAWISFQRIADDHLNLNASLSLSLPNVSAEPLGGARNTRAEIKFSHIAYNDAPDENLSGFWMRHFDIVSHLGMKHMPLVANVAGTGTLLNDGKTPNKLSIYIANPNPKQAVLLRSRLQEAMSATKLIVRFQSESMASGTALDIKSCLETRDPKNEAKRIDQDVFLSEAPTVGESTQQFTFQGEPETSITPDSPIRIDISDWVTHQPSGTMHIYIDYHNIPGYWDGTWVIPVQFGRIVEQNSKVGIGTANPTAALHIDPPENTSALKIERAGLIMNALGTARDGIVLKGKTEGMSHAFIYNWKNEGLLIGMRKSENVSEGTGSNDYILVKTNEVEFNIDVHTKRTLKAFGNTEVQNFMAKGNTEVQNITAKGEIKSEQRIRDKTGYLMPVGSVIAYAGQSEPEGWIRCEGQALYNDSKYSDLRSIVGDYAPDLRARFIVGAGKGLLLSYYNLKQTGGEEMHTLTENEMPRHGHMYHKADYDYHHADGWSGDDSRKGHKDGSNNAWTDFRGGDAAHENRPPYYALYYIIKY